MNTNILVVGVGGQGVMTAAELLARVALASGWDACKTEIAGMSQRGGVVSSQVRIGPHVLASEITPGQVDLLLALEAAEALRWCHWLAPTGRAIVNTLRAVPPIVSSGKAHYPDDPVAAMLELGYDAYSIDAGAIAAGARRHPAGQHRDAGRGRRQPAVHGRRPAGGGAAPFWRQGRTAPTQRRRLRSRA